MKILRSVPVHLVGDGLAAGVVPDELPAAVEGDRVRVVADAVAVVVQELGLLRRPPHLHDPLRHHLQLVVPHAGVHLVRSREVLRQDHLLSDKMSFTVGLVDCYLRVPMVCQPCCLVHCCQG